MTDREKELRAEVKKALKVVENGHHDKKKYVQAKDLICDIANKYASDGFVSKFEYTKLLAEVASYRQAIIQMKNQINNALSIMDDPDEEDSLCDAYEIGMGILYTQNKKADAILRAVSIGAEYQKRRQYEIDNGLVNTQSSVLHASLIEALKQLEEDV